ncbi:hypothetical protein B0T16DRAFT_406611 [Cercophora newfieldiana]|uniref:Uncharacterized protein n=1 Tax=Cercophora newfieldiana TaxID=92897 RepID=A0AA39YHF2_9PEZI|nr:hypothetical protein B0T16DRAFT_406611 [Cercophora newfieldiana]
MKSTTLLIPESESTEALNPPASPDSHPHNESISTSKHRRSLSDRLREAKNKRNAPFSDEELKQYTGMTLDEIMEWARDRPGVMGNPAAETSYGFGMGARRV